MNSFREIVGRGLKSVLILALCVSASFAQQSQGSGRGTLRGQIVDDFGAAIVGATVIVTDASGAEKTVTTNGEGVYSISNLAPGKYTVRAATVGFASYENTDVDVAAGRRDPLDIKLSVTLGVQDEVTVASQAPVSTDPENNAGAVVLRGSDIEALPDDPDDLADALQALAGPSAGPNGGQLYIDGFTGGRLPPRDSIREIRINSNPFSAEFDRLGFGRIEILTRPGTDKFRGQTFFNFGDESLNSRNPLAPNRAPYQRRQYGGNLSGPIISRKASFFFDFQRRDEDDNSLINATILDSGLNAVPFSLAVLTPQKRTTFSPRLDYQLNQNNTLVGRYSYTRGNNLGEGIGNFNLLSRAYNSSNTEHTFQLTETAIINQRVVNETRFQMIRENRTEDSDNSVPAINVLDAFTGGGPTTGFSSNPESRYELQNYTSLLLTNHSFKAGARLRHVSINDISPDNFAGTFTFGGGFAPQLNANNQVVLGANGQPVVTTITSIERYRRTLLFQQQGLTATQIRALGGGATQFSIAGGDPLASVSQSDLGLFAQDDWRVRPDFTVSAGLRYETQNNIESNFNFAPRVSFAFSPGGGGGGQRSQTVIRGGFGVFYERFAESLTLQANRFNGINQQQFIVTDPTVLDLAVFTPGGVSNVPTVASLTGFAIPQTVRTVADNIQSPYTIQSTIGVERQLPFNLTLSVNFINTRTLHLLRSRNINAPLPGTFTPGVSGSGVRPFGDVGNIYQVESSGRLNQQQLFFFVRNQLSRRVSFNVGYFFSKADSDTEGAGGFPSDSYDLSTEYGRSFLDQRHRFFLRGSFTAPWGVRLNPFLIASSGLPFNITTGRDTNGDGLFTERPALATDLAKPGVVVTPYGTFDPNPTPGTSTIPRNYGNGPSLFAVNMNVSKTFGFGKVNGNVPAASAVLQGDGGGPPGGGRSGRGGGGRGGRDGGGGFGGDGGSENRYNVTFSIEGQNILNSTNLSTPNGNLSSSRFGQSLSTASAFGGRRGGGGNQAAGNRRIEFQVRFSF
ncbi:MAG: carboxypeptidase regulatory-like domain-containing protein [Acidobacteriota bacterium]|nr:carboxypeptidase regulatory-like domain-containing protein [Acidobacteriota bacterium]